MILKFNKKLPEEMWFLAQTKKFFFFFLIINHVCYAMTNKSRLYLCGFYGKIVWMNGLYYVWWSYLPNANATSLVNEYSIHGPLPTPLESVYFDEEKICIKRTNNHELSRQGYVLVGTKHINATIRQWSS